MLFKSFVVHILGDFESKFLVVLIKELFIFVAISFSFVLIELFSNNMIFVDLDHLFQNKVDAFPGFFCDFFDI